MSSVHKWQVRAFFVVWLIVLYLFVKLPFDFLILNTFLAFIPIELSFHIDEKTPKNQFLFWIIIIFWILFYPNTPYLLTDLFHLSLLNPYGSNGLLRLNDWMWLNFSFLIISTITSVILGMWGLIKISKSIRQRYNLNYILEIIIIIIFTTLTSVGLFIGRFLRIHTIYLLLTPTMFIKPFLNMWNPRSIFFMLMLTIVQLVILWALHLVIHANHK